MKEERGITLITLVVVIVVILILTGITLKQVFSNNGVLNKAVVSADKYNENQMKYALEIDLKKYSIKKIKVLNSNETLKDYLENKGYEVVPLENNQNKYSVRKNNFEFVVDADEDQISTQNDFEYEDINALTHQHDYNYYDINEIEIGKSHPTEEGTYTYKCACGDVKSAHTISNLSTPLEKDDSSHYTRQCSCNAYLATENHSMAYYSGTTNKGTSHPTAAGTYTYKCACGNGAVTHTVSNLSTPVKKDNNTHYTTKCSCNTNLATANHTYAYYSGTTNKGTSHPTAAGTYTYKCACGNGAVTHTVAKNNDAIDGFKHYTYKCSCGTNGQENHNPGTPVVNSSSNSNHATQSCTVCKMLLVKADSITSSGYDVSVYGIGNVNRVQFPTWTSANGQDDLFSNWQTNTDAKGKYIGGTDKWWYYHVNTSHHNNESGTYYTDIYIYPNSGTSDSTYRWLTINVP